MSSRGYRWRRGMGLMSDLARLQHLESLIYHWGSKESVRWVGGKRVKATTKRGQHFARHYYWILKREARYGHSRVQD